MPQVSNASMKEFVIILGLFTLAVVGANIPGIGDLLIGLLVLAVIAMFLNSNIPNLLAGVK